MKISGVDIRPGNIIEYEGGIWRAVKIQHTQPGKGGAYMQVEMKNLQDGRKTNVRFRSADTVEDPIAAAEPTDEPETAAKKTLVISTVCASPPRIARTDTCHRSRPTGPPTSVQAVRSP